MTVREEVDALFDGVSANVRRRLPPPGVMPADRDPDPRFVAINENFAVLQAALRLLADRLDALETH